MMNKILRLIFNIPTKEEVAQARGKAPKMTKAKPAPSSGGVSSAWGNQGASAPAGISVVKESGGAVAWARGLRILFLIVLLILAWIGIKRIWDGDPVLPPVEFPAAVYFDRSAAEGTALRFARSYLSWDEANAKARASALALDWAGAEQGGWNGRGKQNVRAVYMAGLKIEDNTHATATVAVQVARPAPGEGQPEPTWWVGLDVPLLVEGGRAQVNGRPALVGIPSPVEADKLEYQQDASELATKTKQMAAQFFAAYAAGDVSAVIAPGSTLPALPAGAGKPTLTRWIVQAGGDRERYATAIIAWEVGGAQLSQEYRLKIKNVASPDGQQRWQIASVETLLAGTAAQNREEK